jgi:hypothetical protein
MVVDFIKVEPGMSTKTLAPTRKVLSTVRPRPLSKPIQTMANPQQQIIVIPGNMLIGNKQNGHTTATMEQVKSILKLASTSNQPNLHLKTMVTSTNAKSSTNTITSTKTPVILPTLMKTSTNAAIVRPVNGTQKTAIVSPQQQVQIASNTPRVISLKRPYSATEQNIIKLPASAHIQGLTSFTTEHIKEEEDDDMDSEHQPVRKRANLDHMTSEEKMMRRKLKNRVAAQNARDKKRVKMDDMEDKIKRLEEENKRMQEKNQQLLEFNNRLTKENELLTGKQSQDIEPPTTIIKVEPQTFEDTDLGQNRVLYVPPLSPESLPRSPSPSSSISSSTQRHRISSLDTDDESTASLSSIVSPDPSDVSSLVKQRSVEPAEPINVLQQQELDRRLAGEGIYNSQETNNNNSLLDPSTTALFMTCLMTTVLPMINNLSSQDQKIVTTSSREPLEPLDSSTLPPKKRMSAALHHPTTEKKKKKLHLPT